MKCRNFIDTEEYNLVGRSGVVFGFESDCLKVSFDLLGVQLILLLLTSLFSFFCVCIIICTVCIKIVQVESTLPIGHVSMANREVLNFHLPSKLVKQTTVHRTHPVPGNQMALTVLGSHIICKGSYSKRRNPLSYNAAFRYRYKTPLAPR